MSTETSRKVEFVPPKEFVIPDGDEAGKPFDVVCTFEPKDGKVCMTKFGDHDMPGYDGKDEEAKESPANKPDYRHYAQSMMESQQAT